MKKTIFELYNEMLKEHQKDYPNKIFDYPTNLKQIDRKFDYIYEIACILKKNLDKIFKFKSDLHKNINILQKDCDSLKFLHHDYHDRVCDYLHQSLRTEEDFSKIEEILMDFSNESLKKINEIVNFIKKIES